MPRQPAVSDSVSPSAHCRGGFALPLVLWLLSFALGILALLWGLESLALQQVRQERRRALGQAEVRALLWRRLAMLETHLDVDGGGVGLQGDNWVWRGGAGPVKPLGSKESIQDLATEACGMMIPEALPDSWPAKDAVEARDLAWLQSARSQSLTERTFDPLPSVVATGALGNGLLPHWLDAAAPTPFRLAHEAAMARLQDGGPVLDPARMELRFGPDATGRYPVSPVLTEFALHWGVFAGTPGTGERHDLRLRFFIEAELWNPYAYPLRFPAQAQSRAVRLWIGGLPMIRVRNLTRGLEVGPMDPDLARNEHSGVVGIQGWLEIEAGADRNGQALVLQPGEVYRVLAPWPGQQAEGQARTLGDRVLPLAAGDAVEVELVPKPGGLWARLLPYREEDEGRDLAAVPVLRAWQQVPVASAVLAYPRADVAPRPFLLRLSTDCRLDMMRLSHHWRIAPTQTDTWLRHGGAQARVLDVTAQPELWDSVSVSPDLAADSRGSMFVSEPLMDAVLRSHRSSGRTDLRLWDFPARPPLQLMALRSLGGLTDRDWTQLGSVGHRDNVFFDQTTSWPLDATGARFCALALPESAASVQATTHLRTGIFNINSLSWAAWRGQLSTDPGPLRTGAWAGLSREVGRQDLFVRHRNAEAWLGGWAERDSLLDGGAGAMAARQGLNRLDPVTLDQLAARIVLALRARNLPFASLQEFLDAGLLDQAIDAVGPACAHPDGGPNVPAVRPINDGLWQGGRRLDYLPACLTQADVWERLAPWAVVRGDTWRIQAQVLLPSAGDLPEQELVCEAIVQRLPERLGGALPESVDRGSDTSRDWTLLRLAWR